MIEHYMLQYVSSDAYLPVMVWIHGGAYFVGSADPTGPEYFLDKDVVLVTLNYRLGALGFLSTEDEVLPGNYGLKDQTAALKWVRDNIKYFGGNKDSVTIFGESAGGGSVSLHTMSPLSAGLFHAAIALSGTGHCPWNTFPPGLYKKNAERLGKFVGCSKTKDSKQLAKCLQKLPHETLTKVLLKFLEWNLDPGVIFRPSVEPAWEGAFLTAYPSQSISSVPLIVGIISGEGGFMLSGITRNGLEKGLEEINDRFEELMGMSLHVREKTNDTKSVVKQIREFYFGDKKVNKETLQEALNMYTDAMFLHGMVTSVNHHKGPVYIYYFDYKGSVTLTPMYGNKEDDFGVVHGDTLLYTFSLDRFIPGIKLSKEDTAVSEKFVELFTNFAQYRNPTPMRSTFTLWEPVTSPELEYLHISNNGFAMKTRLLKERADFWNSLGLKDNLVGVKFSSKKLTKEEL